MNPYSFEYTKEGLQVKIDKDELAELMKEEKRQEDLDYIEECNNDRTEEQQGYHDTGMRPSDFY